MKQYARITNVIFLFLLAWQSAYAGEFKCTFSCRLDGIYPDIKWESTSCHKPSPPFLIVSNARDYNDAVRQFNSWISQVDAYNDCVQNEALADLRKMPDVFKKGISESRDEMANEVRRTRSNLEMQRPY